MIGSTLKTMANAEKLSVDQLRQSIKNGTIPAFIGVPLIEEKMRAEKILKQSAAQPQQPPVADRILSESERGVEQLPTNLPTQQYALGGIVAFAGGGDAEDPYEKAYKDYLEAKDLQEDLDIMNAGYDRVAVNETPRTGITAAPSMSYSQVQGQAPRVAGKLASGVEALPGANHKYADTVLKYAEKYGVDPKLALHVLNKETGGMKNPETARSKAGAEGIMQTIPSTSKMLGIKDPFDPEQSAEGGVRYLAQLSKQFKGDPRLTAAAYNAGPGNVRKYGDVPPFRETQGYVQGLKEGGIARFNGAYDPSLIDDENKTRLDLIGDWFSDKAKSVYNAPSKAITGVKEYFTTPVNRGQGTLKGLTDSQIKQLEAEGRENATYNFPQPGIQGPGYQTGEEAVNAARKSGFFAPATAAQTDDLGADNATKPPVDTTQPQTQKSAYDKWIERALAREDRREANANMDRNMGLLAAGLGMLGSQSPYANVGIGQGALAGMSYYQGLQKQRSSEETADLGLMLKAQAYKEAQDIQRERLAQQKESTTTSQQNALETKRMGLLQNYEKLYDNKIAQDLKTAYMPEDQARIRAEWEAKKMQDPTWRKLYEEATGLKIPDTLTGGGAALPQGVRVTRTS